MNMFKYLHITLATLCLLAIPLANAQAQDFDGDSDLRIDSDNDFDIRPYAGVGIGAFGLELKDNTGLSMKKTVFGGYGKFGADIGDYLGAELRIGSSSSGTKGNVKLSDSYFISYLAKFQFPVTVDFKPYAMLGGTTAKFKKTVGGVESSKSKTGFSYGFGADYYIQDNLSLGGEWMQYWSNVKLGTLGTTTGNKAKLWSATATMSYHF